MMRRALACLTALLATIPFGLAVRFWLPLPWFWAKYLGSALWAVALYWFIAMLLPRLRPMALLVLTSILAVLVELSRLTPEPHIDAFRLTLAGKLLLGRYFSAWNIVTYLAAIAACTAVDRFWHPGASNHQAN